MHRDSAEDALRLLLPSALLGFHGGQANGWFVHLCAVNVSVLIVRARLGHHSVVATLAMPQNYFCSKVAFGGCQV